MRLVHNYMCCAVSSSSCSYLNCLELPPIHYKVAILLSRELVTKNPQNRIHTANYRPTGYSYTNTLCTKSYIAIVNGSSHKTRMSKQDAD